MSNDEDEEESIDSAVAPGIVALQHSKKWSMR